MTSKQAQPVTPGLECCARCDEPTEAFAVRWPEGPLCVGCYRRARWRKGVCAECGVQRQLPGRNKHKEPICADCGSIPLDQHCSRCGQEAYIAKSRACHQCLLEERINNLFPKSGVLDPLLQSVRDAASPQAGYVMLNNPAYSRPLQALHTGEVACSHKGIDDLVPAGQQQDHLRSLLIQSGLLEPLDLHLRRFETWCGHHIGEMAFDESRDVMRLYARWSQGRHLRRHQQQDTLTAGVALAARQRTSVAISFVEWVGSLGLGLAEVGQGDLDHWLAEGTSTRRHVASFITWANASGQTIGLKMPPRQSGTRPVLSQNERLRLLRTYFHDPTVPIDVRIAGLFLLLFATPITRIVALTPNDFTDDRASWTPGSVAVPLPMRLQELVVEQFASPKLRGSAAHGLVVVWLFPGRIPGQHLTAQVIRERLHEHGLPKLGPGRNSAVAALVRELPAPVAGQVCGIGSEVAARWATDLGTDRGSYPHHRNKSGE